MKVTHCDGCCFNKNPNPKYNCTKIVCNFAYIKDGKFKECLINENPKKTE